jgi:tetratricopeptide (TPR) repeat protein
MAVLNQVSSALRGAQRTCIALSMLWLAACTTAPTTAESPPTTTSATTAPPDTTTTYKPIPADTLYDLLVAELASNRNQYPLALEKYQRQAIKTRDPQIAAQAARLANAVGSPQQAEQMASLWLELEPTNADAHFIQAVALSRQGQSRQSFEHMQRVGELKGDVSYAHIAADSLNQSSTEQAALLAAINDALAAQPDDVELLMAKSIVQQASDQEAALATARKARKLAPENEQTVILEASLLKQMSRHQETMDLLQNSVERTPDNVRIRRFYAQSLFTVDPQLAAVQFELLLNLTPNDPDTLFFLGLAYTRSHQYDEAKIRFEQLISLGARQSEAHYHLGLIALQQEQLQRAIEHFERVEPGPEYLSAMTQIAKILIITEQPNALHQRFSIQRDKHPTLSISLYILESDILTQLEAYTDAHALLNEALEQHKQNTRLLYARALVAEKQGDMLAAEADLRQILTLEPDNTMAMNALGYLLSNHSQRYEEAHQLIERALQQKPDDPTILDSMGWVNFRLGDLDSALSYLEQAYQRYPDAEIGAHLGEALWQSGQQERAIEVWREALQQDPEHSVLRETLQRFDVLEQLETGTGTGTGTGLP